MTSVPCNGCTACCQNDLIMLHPEMGDDPARYPGGLMRATNPITGESGLALRHKEGGGCWYVGPNGCTIHDRAPAVCKEFDCRRLLKQFMSLPRPERRRLQKRLDRMDLFTEAVKEAALERMHTLEDDAA